MALFGTARAFANPAAQAIVPNLVPQAHLANAIAWKSTTWQTATIGGPALGGLLYAFGRPWCSAAHSRLRVRGAPPRPRHALPGGARGPAEKTSWSSLVAGIAFIRSRPVILGAISLDLFAVLLGGATALLPVFARDILHVGPGAWPAAQRPAVGRHGDGRSSWPHRPLRRKRAAACSAASPSSALATIVFGLSQAAAVAGALAVLGAADMISVYVRQTLVQLDTPDQMRGRVAAVNAVFIGASNELGEFEIAACCRGRDRRRGRGRHRRHRHDARGRALGALVPGPAGTATG